MQLQVGVKVILIDQNGSVLILRRTKPLSNGKIVWDIPGGRINPEETTDDALIREVYEETGINLPKTFTLVDVQDIFPYDDLHIVRLTYTCKIDKQSVTLSDEHDDIAWITLGALANYELDPFVDNSIKGLYERA